MKNIISMSSSFQQALAVLGSCLRLARVSPTLQDGDSTPILCPYHLSFPWILLSCLALSVESVTLCQPPYLMLQPGSSSELDRDRLGLLEQKASCRTVPTAQQHMAAYLSCAPATPRVPRDLQESSRPSLVSTLWVEVQGKG